MMNGVIRSSFKLQNCSLLGVLSRHVRNEYAISRFFNTLENTSCKASVNLISKSPFSFCNNAKNYSKESNDVAVQLTKFLEQEITSEKELMGTKTIPSKIDDFEVKLDGSEVTLTKTGSYETIEVNFNINRSVQSDDDEFDENTHAANEAPELRSKPDFDVDIKRGNTTLGFSCQFVEGNIEDVTGDGPDDVFVIDEVTLYSGEYSEKAYSVGGEILDAYLYDLLMNLLNSKGVTSEFAMKLSDLSTAYEQTSYISLLRALKDFASK